MMIINWQWRRFYIKRIYWAGYLQYKTATPSMTELRMINQFHGFSARQTRMVRLRLENSTS
ncbi:hypothetical protein N825_12635 [Skermanella stibiiresistens SB22]|uniref:Transposase n=1 Tax=Skermanella stibiiresistens SB22 TaxID=1385369 RepID=W9H1S7_9PROT|nr:hypothetical protein N825_12635 [Skermanella stibiiresistens SB22]